MYETTSNLLIIIEVLQVNLLTISSNMINCFCYLHNVLLYKYTKKKTQNIIIKYLITFNKWNIACEC
jgi:hypothetical protein